MAEATILQKAHHLLAESAR